MRCRPFKTILSEIHFFRTQIHKFRIVKINLIVDQNLVDTNSSQCKMLQVMNSKYNTVPKLKNKRIWYQIARLFYKWYSFIGYVLFVSKMTCSFHLVPSVFTVTTPVYFLKEKRLHLLPIAFFEKKSFESDTFFAWKACI